jgi:hypothetical protein
MIIKADIKVMNNVTFSQRVTLETNTVTGSVILNILDRYIELSRNDLLEFLIRTEPRPSPFPDQRRSETDEKAVSFSATKIVS